MTLQQPHRATQYLAQLRSAGPRPVSLPPDLAPRSEAEAYQLQSDTMSALRARGGVWKVAMTNAHSGTCAPIFASDVYPSGARVDSPITDRFGIEPEIAFTFKSALSPLPQGRHYLLDQIVESIAAAHTAIEVLVSRFRSHEEAAPLDRLADNLSNGGLVLGTGITDWQQLDLGTLPLRLLVEDAGPPQVHAARGGHPLDSPLLPVLWLANYCSQRGVGLDRGDIVTTGSFAGLRYVGRGAHVSVQFEGLGVADLYS